LVDESRGRVGKECVRKGDECEEEEELSFGKSMSMRVMMTLMLRRSRMYNRGVARIGEGGGGKEGEGEKFYNNLVRDESKNVAAYLVCTVSVA